MKKETDEVLTYLMGKRTKKLLDDEVKKIISWGWVKLGNIKKNDEV